MSAASQQLALRAHIGGNAPSMSPHVPPPRAPGGLFCCCCLVVVSVPPAALHLLLLLSRIPPTALMGLAWRALFLNCFRGASPGGVARHRTAAPRRNSRLHRGRVLRLRPGHPRGLHSTAPRHRTGRSRTWRRTSSTSSSFGGGTHTGTEGGGGEGGRGVPPGGFPIEGVVQNWRSRFAAPPCRPLALSLRAAMASGALASRPLSPASGALASRPLSPASGALASRPLFLQASVARFFCRPVARFFCRPLSLAFFAGLSLA